MQELIQAAFAGPTVAASVLLVIVCLYWLCVMFGALDLDVFDFDLDADFDADVGGETLSIGFVTLRWLNIGQVPLMLWASFFALSFWGLSMFAGRSGLYEQWGHWSLPVLANVGISVLAAKVLTQPLRGRFDPVEPHKAEELIGKTCTVTTREANGQSGQARNETEAAPLFLQVRTAEETEPLSRNETAVIVDFDSDRHVYVVASATSEQGE